MSKAARILDFARIASALVVVVGVTSHLGSGAALSPRRCRIASVGASNRTEMLRVRGVLLTIVNPSTSRIESSAALNPSGLQKKVHQQKERKKKTDNPRAPAVVAFPWSTCSAVICRTLEHLECSR